MIALRFIRQLVGHLSPFKSSKIEYFKRSDSNSVTAENLQANVLVFIKESTKKHVGETPLHILRNLNKTKLRLTTYFFTDKGLSTFVSFRKCFSTCFFWAIFFCVKKELA